MTTTYQVVAECAHVTMNHVSGRALTLLLKGALVPADAPELPRLLELGYVAKADGETGGVDASGIPAGAYTADVPAAITSTPVEKSADQRQADADAAEKSKADAELAEKRAAAQAKLAALDGKTPDGRQSADVLVEYLTARGYDFGELSKQDKDELVKLAKQQP